MELITEKYRPKCIGDLVSPSTNGVDLITKIKQWKSNGKLDSHLIFYGPAGTGKSSSVKVILNELGINDYMIINGSDKTSIDDTRNIIDYASVPPLTDSIKIVVYEEFERLSAQAQDSLKYVLEQYSAWCRFIFTTNNISKVTNPIISRCEVYNFKELNKKEFINKVISILMAEKITFDVEDATDYIDCSYPDLRYCLNLINKNTINNDDGTKILVVMDKDNATHNEKFDNIITLWNANHNHQQIRELLSSTFTEDDYEQMYRYLYLHLEKIDSNKSKWDIILSKIAEYLYRNPTVAYKDLNFMACLCDISLSIK